MPQMWEKAGEAADQRIYGPDFQKELARATFDHPLSVAGKEQVIYHLSFRIFHFTLF